MIHFIKWNWIHIFFFPSNQPTTTVMTIINWLCGHFLFVCWSSFSLDIHLTMLNECNNFIRKSWWFLIFWIFKKSQKTRAKREKNLQLFFSLFRHLLLFLLLSCLLGSSLSLSLFGNFFWIFLSTTTNHYKCLVFNENTDNERNK